MNIQTGISPARTAWRYRMASKAFLANLAASGAGLLLTIATVRWASPYLGAERFGVWATFASFAAMLSFLDLGLGNALVNQVAKRSSDGDVSSLRQLVSGGLGWLATIGLLASTTLAALAAHLPWHLILHLQDRFIADEARATAIIFAILFGAHLISSGTLKILVGQQRSHEANLVNFAASLMALALLWKATNERSDISTLMMAAFGPQALLGLLTVPVLWRRKLLRFECTFAGMALERKDLMQLGGAFLVLQLGTVLGWGTDALLVATLNGPGEVASLVIAQRLFQIASRPVYMLNAPLWAAYADAHAQGDREFLRKTLRLSGTLSVVIGGGIALMLLLASPWIVPFWTKGTIDIPTALLVSMGVWTVLELCGSALSTYLNGVGVLREQAIVVVLFCAIALPLKIICTIAAGATGLVVATIVSYIIAVAGLYATVFFERIREPLSDGAIPRS